MGALADAVLDAARKQASPELHRARWQRPGDLAKACQPKTVDTPALQLIDDALTEALNTPDSRTIITMPPQEGKSTRVTTFGPLWALTRNPDLRIAIASYQQDLANEFGWAIRSYIQDNQGEDGTLDLGLSIREDHGAVSSWKLAAPHEGGVRSVGLSSGLTGRPADVLFVDDPISNMEQAESTTYRKRVWNWWLSVGSTRLAPGAPVIIILTRWHHDDIVGRLKAAEDGHLWKVINIPAEAEDEDDPLEREPGEFMESARGERDWEAIKKRVGPRVWASMYQGHPTPQRGKMFCPDWPEYDSPLWVVRRDGSLFIPGLHNEADSEMAQSWDMSFKDSDDSSYVVGQVWLRRGQYCYLLDQIRDRMGFSEAVEALLGLTAKWPQALPKFIEDKANGPAVINFLGKKVSGLIPIEPEGSKFARASAVSPLTHSGNVIVPAPLDAFGEPFAPWISAWKDEMRDFPNGANDDQVDGMSQALNRMLLQPLLEEDWVEPEEFSGLDERGWSISPV